MLNRHCQGLFKYGIETSFAFFGTKVFKPSHVMSRIICKFGGSSVAGPEQYQQIQHILSHNPKRRVVVVSAAGKQNPSETKITDLLYACHELAHQNLPFGELFEKIKERYVSIEASLGLQCGMKDLLEELKNQLTGGVTQDFAVSRGEYLSGKLIAAHLGGVFIDPEKHIFFDSLGRIDSKTYVSLKEALSEEDRLYVLPGFYGQDANGKVKTFSRGGSDITGAIAARAIHAETYENWTDVSGLLMADPRIVDSPKAMEQVSYREIRELAYMGANVFHDEAIAPVRELNIPIQIKNTHRPEDPGTTIVGRLSSEESPAPNRIKVAGIAGKKHASVFNIEKNMMNKERGFGRKVLGIFESHGVNYEHSPTGIDSMSVVVLQKELGSKAPQICEDIERVMEPDSVTLNEDLSLIATVGEGMNHSIGTAAQLFGALYEENINVRIIDQGSSELNIIVGVDSMDYEKAINALYKRFVEVA